MKFYQNVKRDIIPPVDLTVLGNTYNTLQEGHLKAIELGSKLRTQIANLPLNEKESAFKEQLGNEIEEVIDNNSVGGNAYYALDELIKSQGDIARNPELINKLQAQADYKSYIDAIDNNKELTGDMKEYYKEMNPYRNGDILDKDGNKVGYDNTFKWQSTKNPTKVFDVNDFILQGIKLAAPEFIDYNSTTFLDANGNVTTDPAKALDGKVFYTVNGQREVLSKEKIIESINSVIDSTPGARESIQQDYDVALWKYRKNQEEGIENELINSPILDANGSLLTSEEYKNNLISRAASVSAYVKGSPKRTYGSGLESYKAYQRGEGFGGKLSTGKGNKTDIQRNFYDLGSNPFNLSINRNLGKQYTVQKNDSKNAINELLAFRGLEVNDDNIDDTLNSLINSPNVSPQEKNALIKYYRQYEESIGGLESAKSVLNESDRDKLDFGLRITGGERPNANKTKYDKNYYKYKNRMLDDNGNIIINIDKSDYDNLRENGLFNELINESNGDVKLTHNSNNYQLQILDTNGNIDDYLMQVASMYKNSRKETKTNIGKFIYTIEGIRGTTVWDKENSGRTKRNLNKLADLFDNANEYSNIDNSIIRDNSVEGLTRVTTIGNQSFEGFVEESMVEMGLSGRTDSQVNAIANQGYQRVKGIIESGLNPSVYDIYEVKDLDNVGDAYLIEGKNSSAKYAEASKNMSIASQSDMISMSPGRNPIAGVGMTVTVFEGTNKDNRKIKSRYFVAGLGEGEATDMIFNDTEIRSRDNLDRVNAYDDNIVLLSSLEVPYLNKAVSLSKNKSNPNLELFDFSFGNDIVTLGYNNAQLLEKNLLDYRDICDNLRSGYYTNQDLERYSYLLNERIYPILSNVLQLSTEDVENIFDVERLIQNH